MFKNRKKIFFGLAIFILILFLLSTLDLYISKKDIFCTKYLISAFHLPIVKVNNELINSSDYFQAWRNYRKSFLKPLGKNNKNYKYLVIDTIIRENLLKQIADDLEINWQDQEFEDFKKNFYRKYIGEENFNNLKSDTNWQESYFCHYVIRPLFLRFKVDEKLIADELNREKKKEIEEIYEKIIDQPNLFDEYSQTYQDPDLISTGTIGWIPYQNLPDNLRNKILNYQIGDFSPILKSLSGYHIYKLTGKIKDEKNGDFYYQLRQIFLPIKNFESYFQGYIQESNIKVYLK
ncbi:peptidylprolyl isomerase [bacterium]|nr:peptidylprolyl isomerase [bacterium]